MWLQPTNRTYLVRLPERRRITLQAIGTCVGHYDATTVSHLQKIQTDENAAGQSGELSDIEVVNDETRTTCAGHLLIVAGLLLVGYANPVIAAKKLTELGIFPYLQTRSLVRIHTPLASLLQSLFEHLSR